MKKSLFILLTFVAVSAAANVSSLKVGTYNIRFAGSYGDTGWKDWSSRKTYVARTVTTYDYDIIGMNECRGGVQLTDLQTMLGDTYAFVLYNDQHAVPGYPEGYEPILYKKDKFLLLDSGCFYLNAEDITKPGISWDNSAGNYRLTAWAKLQVKETGQILFYFQTHLDHQGEDARNEQTRINMEQVRLIAAGYPAILCGDHNASKARPPFYNMMASYMDDSRMVATTKINIDKGEGTLNKHKVDGRDFWDPAYKSGSRLDYIWIRGMKASEYRHIDDTFGNQECPSDHIAIQAVVTLDERPKSHVLYVDAQAADGGDGTKAKPYRDLQTALDSLAWAGDTIMVKAGKMPVSGKGKNATVKVSKTATLIGGYNDDFSEVIGMTELNGDVNGDDKYDNFNISNTSDNLYRIVTVANTCALEIENFNIHGANAPQSQGQGGGIYCPGYRLKVENCWIHDNVSYSNGAGIYAGGALDVIRCKMNNNVSLYGSGGACYTVTYSGELYWRMSVRDSEFYGNRGTMGGAYYNGGFSWLSVVGNSFYNNKSTNAGIAYAVRTGYDGNLTFANNTFANNILEATTASGLSSKLKGGSAIMVKMNGANSKVAIVNNTIVGNSASCLTAGAPSADFYGAAVQTISDCSMQLRSNIIAGNKTTATTGADVNVLKPENTASNKNVFTCASDVNCTMSATDCSMSTREAGISALAKTLDGEVKDGDFIAHVEYEHIYPVVAVKDLAFGIKYINDVRTIDMQESVFLGDVTFNAQMKESLKYDQRYAERNQNDMACRGAYEYGRPAGIEDVSLSPALSTREGAIYNLQGVKVSSIQHGQLYIRDGKKYIMK
ncbi:MAG: endonuclease/exonuclease/phosphatase family protein [Bacteroidaceae bacterium]|nr:endonuclease/exonuclease/phosphatase family protein [Bacteroidaceae bacterium]